MKIPAVEFSPAVAAKMSLPVVNDSGMIPVEYRCVVRLDPVEEEAQLTSLAIHVGIHS